MNVAWLKMHITSKMMKSWIWWHNWLHMKLTFPSYKIWERQIDSIFFKLIQCPLKMNAVNFRLFWEFSTKIWALTVCSSLTSMEVLQYFHWVAYFVCFVVLKSWLLIIYLILSHVYTSRELSNDILHVKSNCRFRRV